MEKYPLRPRIMHVTIRWATWRVKYDATPLLLGRLPPLHPIRKPRIRHRSPPLSDGALQDLLELRAGYSLL
jgi:hypothetical protein